MVAVHLKSDAMEEAAFTGAVLKMIEYQDYSEYSRSVTDNFLYVPEMLVWIPWTLVTHVVSNGNRIPGIFAPVIEGAIEICLKEGPDIIISPGALQRLSHGLEATDIDSGQEFFVPLWNVKRFSVR